MKAKAAGKGWVGITRVSSEKYCWMSSDCAAMSICRATKVGTEREDSRLPRDTQ